MTSTAELRKTYVEFAKTLYSPKPLYAFAGVGDYWVEQLRRTPEHVSKLRAEQKNAAAKVVGVPVKVVVKVAALPADALRLTAKLGEKADEQVKAADARYDDLAGRGEQIVKRIRSQKSTQDLINQAQSTVTKARSVRGAANRGATNTKTAAKGTATSARKTATKAGAAANAAGSKVGD